MNLQLDKGGLKGEERGFIAGRSLYVCICLLMVILTWLYLQGNAERNCFYEPAMV
jgi:hypothetical protein